MNQPTTPDVTSETYSEFVARLPWRYRLLWDYMRVSGLRVSDALRLRRADLAAGYDFEVKERKTGHVMVVRPSTWPDKLRGRLMAQARGPEGYVWASPRNPAKPIGRRQAWRVIAKAAELAELEGLTPHSARHLFAHALGEAGMKPCEVQAVMGHKNIGMTLRYLYL